MRSPGDELRWAPDGALSPGVAFPLRGLKRFIGTRVTVKQGIGTEDDPHREVTYWFDEHELLLATHDPADEIDTTRGPQDRAAKSDTEAQ